MWLVDLTRAHGGTERTVVDRIETLDGYPGDGAVELLALTSQLAAISHVKQTVRSIDRTRTDEEGILRECMQVIYATLRQATPDSNVTLRTYRPKLMAAASAMALGDPRLIVERMPTHEQAGTEWPKNYIPLEEALRHLTRAVGSATTEVNQTSLRHELELVSSRWAKQSEPAAQTPGLVSMLVSEGIKRQLIREETVPDRPGRPNFVLGPEAAKLKGTPGPAPSPTGSGATFEPLKLSTMYIDSLRGANMGPFQEVRWDVYDAVESRLGEGLSARELLRAAVADVKEEKNTLLSRRKPFPWSRVRVFMVRLTSRAGVLLHDQDVVWHSLEDSGMVVNGLVPNWRLVLDAELFKELLLAGLEINQFSADELAGALYNKRDDEQLDRAMDLMKFVVTAGIACEDPDKQGNFILREGLV